MGRVRLGVLVGAGVGALCLPIVAFADDAAPQVTLLGGARKVMGDESPYHVAFTFDDGPKFETTPLVLAALTRYDIPAAFFVVGHRFVGKKEAAIKNAELLDEEIHDGYLIGNHTFNHVNLRKEDDAAMRSAIDRNADAIAGHLGYRPQLFRPPYGAMSAAAAGHTHKLGYTTVIWSVDQKDWVKAWRKSLRKRLIHEIIAEHGGVVLMHDTRAWTAETVASIFDDLEAENCRREEHGEKLIVPVSLHYFLREKDGSARPIPPDVEARTRHYLSELPARCAAREPAPQSVAHGPIIPGAPQSPPHP
jgi:peptidoglycan/xylan/chitin deacetylase (PgdA/CDA1 family)